MPGDSQKSNPLANPPHFEQTPGILSVKHMQTLYKHQATLQAVQPLPGNPLTDLKHVIHIARACSMLTPFPDRLEVPAFSCQDLQALHAEQKIEVG